MNETVAISKIEYSEYQRQHEENTRLREEIMSLKGIVQKLQEEISLLKQDRNSGYKICDYIQESIYSAIIYVKNNIINKTK
jgi:hypothetical protein